jgi:hypothetical protein
MKLIDPGTDFNDNDAPTKTDKPQPYDPDSAYNIDDFVALSNEGKFIHLITQKIWGRAEIDSQFSKLETGGTYENGKPIKIRASQWLAQKFSVEGIFWDPAQPQIMENVTVNEGGLNYNDGLNTYNSYLPPNVPAGEASKAQPWLDLVKTIYPRQNWHIIEWLAYKVQNPGSKINHALVLGGKQGIGKDTLLQPVIQAVGEHNSREISPVALLGNNNGFVQSVILRISEAVDMGKRDRYKFYEHTKTLIAAPPNLLQCNKKYIPLHPVKNVCGIILTTNHKTGGIYIPAGDRRHFIAWSPLSKNDFEAKYFSNLWKWYNEDGCAHVAAFLQNLDLSEFNPKAPPRKTQAWHEFVDAGQSPQDAEFASVLSEAGWPDIVYVNVISANAPRNLGDWMSENSNKRQIPHRFEEAGYSKILNPDRKDNRWKVNGKHTTIYGLEKLTIKQRIEGAQNYDDHF